MSKIKALSGYKFLGFLLLLAILLNFQSGYAQTFQFDRIYDKAKDYTVILDMKIELSFGMQTNEQEERILGTIVTEEGLVMFDGSFLDIHNPLSAFSGMTFKTRPSKIEITTLDGEKFTGRYLGVDRYTGMGFVEIVNPEGIKFKKIKFTEKKKFDTGSWIALFMLLPDYIEPPLAADVGMISAMVTSPEEFPLTVGFSGMEIGSVVYDDRYTPVGVLGTLSNPASSSSDAGGFLDNFGEFEMPLLGVITADRLEKIIANPPTEGEVEKSWLGITLQALTEDLADYFNLDLKGGIIVNDVVNNSPADKAGLKVNDIIYEVNGQPITIDRDELLPIFQRQIADMGPGTAVEFSVIRPTDEGFDTLKVFTTLENRPLAANEADEYENNALEFKVRNLVFSDYLYYNLDEDELSGVVVSELKPGGLSFIGGLQIGDIIQRINNQPVENVGDVEKIMDEIEISQPSEVIFFVWRNSQTLFVNVKTDWKS